MAHRAACELMGGLYPKAGGTRLGSARRPAHAVTPSSLGGLVWLLAAWVVGCGDDPAQTWSGPAMEAGAGPGAPVVDAGGSDSGQDGMRPMDSGLPAVPAPQEAGVPAMPDAALADAQDADAAAPTMPAVRRTLVDPDRWTVLGEAEDPFDDRPDDVSCPDEGVSVELLMGEYTFEVDTGVCSYVTASQTTLRDLAAGETLKARVWHYSLTGPDGSQAHVVLQVGDRTVVEERLPIPGPGGLTAIELPLEEPLPSGTPVYLHIHNHGDNTYAMVELSGGPPT